MYSQLLCLYTIFYRTKRNNQSFASNVFLIIKWDYMWTAMAKNNIFLLWIKHCLYNSIACDTTGSAHWNVFQYKFILKSLPYPVNSYMVWTLNIILHQWQPCWNFEHCLNICNKHKEKDKNIQELFMLKQAPKTIWNWLSFCWK